MNLLPRFVLMPVLCSVLAMQACALPDKQFAARLDPVLLPDAELVGGPADELDTLTEGDTVTFDNGFLAELGQLSVGREYNSASGRECKQILDKTGTMLVGVACKRRDQKWYTRQGS